MPIFLESLTTITLADGDVIDLYAGNPRSGTQPLQSVAFTASAPNLLFTGIDLAQPYTLVHRAPVGFRISVTPNVGPG